ncbi:DUF4184 family protein [Flavobacterium lindanitolerans]|uniref:Uncharacterized protein DUF4184 n=1 Tax=Flavobacterium lindanitolerans TaxID=428988 RepID=A0A497UHV3_9FLAO|nr:DUF4184 family protein [Flavobacterium lindanitolerans]PKW29863.1 uncharacterized protein DUF4184 [Flavobacterium lindanitolerans]RLJ24203.1 uncharacterized protein DUF4184 [Flavobacterium lindanitolerans]
MPFTFSHPAIVLPMTFLNRKWFSLTGLVIGSMTPDFEYFLRMKTSSNYSHTIAGVFWFDLPLGIILSFIFHNIVRNNLFDNLPVPLRLRISTFKQFDWNKYFQKNWLIVIISILIGAFSHIFWDGFTHQHAYFVEKIPSLQNTIRLFEMQIPYWKVLQHLSTFIGALIILFAILRLPKDTKAFKPLNRRYWIVSMCLTLAIVFIRLFCGLDYKLYGHLIVTIISAWFISLILTPILIRKHNSPNI